MMNKVNEEKGAPNVLNRIAVVIALLFFFFVVVLLIILCIYAILRRRVYFELPLARSNRSWRQRISSMREDRHLRSGLDDKIMEALPILVYRSQSFRAGGTDCSVCLQDFEDGESVRVLPDCKHCFHTDCIDMWFHSHSNCPLCRTKVEAQMDNVKIHDGGDAENVVIEMNFAVEEEQDSSPHTTQSDIDLSTELNGLQSEQVSSPNGSRFCRLPSLRRILSGRSRDGRVFPSTNEIQEFW